MKCTVKYHTILLMSDEERKTFISQLGLPHTELPSFMENLTSRYGDKPYCVVGDWEWLEKDFRLNGEMTIKIFYIYADFVIDDQLGRFPYGGWVRTSQLIAVHDNCVYETANTLYILANHTNDELTASET